MLHIIGDLEDFTLHAAGDNIGLVKDFYFDDESWSIRYLILETGSWLDSRKVLISSRSITHMNREDKTFSVNISLYEIKNSPDIDTQKPVSRQHEIQLQDYYGYPSYWADAGLNYFATSASLENIAAPPENGNLNVTHNSGYDHHLQSCKAIIGYEIQAVDGDIGHVHEMLIDEKTWAIRYFVVKTSSWFGKQVIVSPQWIENISWEDKKVVMNLSRQAIKDAPIYDPSVPFNRQSEEQLYLHYDRRGYWE